MLELKQIKRLPHAFGRSVHAFWMMEHCGSQRLADISLRIAGQRSRVRSEPCAWFLNVESGVPCNSAPLGHFAQAAAHARRGGAAPITDISNAVTPSGIRSGRRFSTAHERAIPMGCNGCILAYIGGPINSRGDGGLLCHREKI